MIKKKQWKINKAKEEKRKDYIDDKRFKSEMKEDGINSSSINIMK